MLGYMEQTPLYNAINFNWAPEGDGTWSGPINSTVFNTLITIVPLPL